MTPQRAVRFVAGLSALVSVWLLAGCGASFSGSGATVVKATPSALTGTVRGGSQPISGSQVYLYAVSTSQDAGPASPLLNSPGYVTTLSDGSFSLAGDFTCPAGAYVYLLAKGGNPGLASGTNNAEIALAAGLGLCSAITSSTHVSLNEVTTVATAYSLAAYASSETNIGANNAVANTLGSAFANIPELIDMGTGYALTTNASGGIVPQATIDSLANALAACVSSDGTGTLCSSLMTAANVTGANGTPVDTFQAALKIAQNPTVNVQGIFNLPPSGSPFQPNLSAKPNDWTVSVTYPGGASPPPVYYVSMTPGSATIYQNGTQMFAATVNGSSSGSGFSYQWYTTATAGLMTDTTVTGQAAQSTYCSANAQSTYVPNTTPTVTSSTFDSVEVSVFTGPGCATANFIGSIATRISVVPDVSTTAIPVFTTTPYSGTVVLPTGTKLTPDQLSVVTSVTSTTPLPSGAFTVTEYANGEQIAAVLSPAGNPMLMGWMDSSHPTISASTTAEVLAFFALGGHLMLNESDRNEMIAGIPQQSGFSALVQAISTEIAANPDAFSTTDANVQAAVAAFYTAVTGLTAPAVKQPSGGTAAYLSRPGGAAAKPNSVLPTPSATSAQSGITFTGQDPTQAYATNAFRRRAHVFVLRQNDVTFGSGGPQNYMYTPDAVAVTDFDLAPTVGLTGGVTGAISDIFKAYFGTQPTAYAPVDSDPFTLPVTSGFDGTTYQVLSVGAGGSGAPSPVTLTPGQKSVLVTTAVNGLVNDALVPFVTNVSFGSGSLTNSSGAPVSGAAAAFQTAFIGSLESQVLALTQLVSGQQDKIVAGDYAGAAKEILFGVEASKFQDAVSAAISTAVGQSGFNIAAASSALTKFNFVMKAADTGL
jgi:hypothetical protein